MRWPRSLASPRVTAALSLLSLVFALICFSSWSWSVSLVESSPGAVHKTLKRQPEGPPGRGWHPTDSPATISAATPTSLPRTTTLLRLTTTPAHETSRTGAGATPPSGSSTERTEVGIVEAIPPRTTRSAEPAADPGPPSPAPSPARAEQPALNPVQLATSIVSAAASMLSAIAAIVSAGAARRSARTTVANVSPSAAGEPPRLWTPHDGPHLLETLLDSPGGRARRWIRRKNKPQRQEAPA
jgi:hypothetical protein